MNEPAARLTAFLATLLILLIWERIAAWRPARPGWRRALENLALGVCGALAIRLLLPWIAIDAAKWARSAGVGLLQLLPLPGAARGVAGFVLLDLSIYLQHRAFHAVPWLWRIHAVHHSETDLNVTTGLRFHPVELVLSMLWKIVVVVLLGAPPGAVLAFEIALNAITMFNHANIRISDSLDSVLRWFVVTPRMHRVHHSIRATELRRNYSFNLPWWDRLFNSYRTASAASEPELTIGMPTAANYPTSGLMPLLLAPLNSNAKSYG
jgi:sterol desaturase/sphingolipid hydroxylase (fatty acid hydroxylase superfamily)